MKALRRISSLTLTLIVIPVLSWNAYVVPNTTARSIHSHQARKFSSLSAATHSSGIYELLQAGLADATSKLKQPLPTTASFEKQKSLTNTNKIFLLALGAGALIVFSLLSAKHASALMLSLLVNYKSSMALYPLITKVATGAALAVMGDALAQLREEGKRYDPTRALSFAAFDSCYRFFQHHAFPTIISIGQGNTIQSLISLIPGVVVGTNLRHGMAALERTLMYQFGVIPLLYYPIFFTFTGYLQGLSPKDIWLRAKTSFLPCWKKNLMFWIPTQMVMFGLIDEKWQIPFACLMGMLWSTILSVTAGNAKTSSKSKAT